MFALETFVDTVQSSKRWFITHFITDKDVQSVWYSYIDTQTTFVKQAIKTGELMTKKFEKLKI